MEIVTGKRVPGTPWHREIDKVLSRYFGSMGSPEFSDAYSDVRNVSNEQTV